jgi:hypothetical protein
MKKFLSLEIENFLENIIFKYNLEEDFINRDSELKKNLEKITDPSERITTKLLYSKEINNYLDQKTPLENFIPSFMLNKITERLINNEFPIEKLKEELELKLKIPPSLSIEIAQKLVENPEILKMIDEEIAPEPPNENILSTENQTPKGIGQELF